MSLRPAPGRPIRPAIRAAAAMLLATMVMVLMLASPPPGAAAEHSPPSTVCTTAQLENVGATSLDTMPVSYTSGGTRYWYLSEDWGDMFHKFSGGTGAPCSTPVWTKTRDELFTNASSIDGQPWIVGMYQAAEGLLAFIHIERAGGVDGQKGRIGLARSTDSGETFTYLGHILSPEGDNEMSSGGFMQGAPYLVSGGYIYLYYSDNQTLFPGVMNPIAVARAELDDVIDAAFGSGTTSPWFKHYAGGWSEAGLGGRYTPITGASGISHGAAARSTYDGKLYLTTSRMAWTGSQSETWVRLWESTDAVNWSLSDTIVSDIGENVGPNTGYQYVTIVDAGGAVNATVGRTFHVYVGFRPYEDDFTLKRWTVDLAQPGVGSGPVPTYTAPTASSRNTYSSSSQTSAARGPQRAFDADPNTDWTAAPGSVYSQQWLQVDFGGEIRTFNHATISEYPGQTSAYRIEYWATGAWHTAYDGTTLGGWHDPSAVTFPAVAGSKARLVFISGSNVPIIYEFALDYVQSSGNLAEGRSYSASSTGADFAAGNAFDGVLATAWSTPAGTNIAGQWVEVDFGSALRFNKVILNEYGNRTTGFRIEYWNGATWSTAHTGTTIGGREEYRVISFPAVLASKARIVFTSGTQATIRPILYEFEVFEIEASPILQYYSGSSSVDATRTPDRAFDGSKGTDWSGIPSAGYAGQWVQVEYGTDVVVSQMTATEYPGQTSGYRVEVWSRGAWHTAATGTTLGAWPSELTVTFPAITGSRARLLFTDGTNVPILYEVAFGG